MKKLEGKVAIITGASSGFGQATAVAFAKEGCSMILTARRKERLEELAKEVEKLGGHAEICCGDAREEETAKNAVDLAIKKFGKLDILINNAGIGKYVPLMESSIKEYEEIMDSNMRTTFIFTRHAIPHMLEQGSGMVLMVSSMAGIYGYPNETIYCASKFAQVGFAQSLDKEFRTKGIKACALCPGAARTEFAIGNGRTEEQMDKAGMLEPEDIANAILFACTQSENSRIIEMKVRSMNEPLTGPGV